MGSEMCIRDRFFLGLGLPLVAESLGFIIIFICFSTQQNLVNRKDPYISVHSGISDISLAWNIMTVLGSVVNIRQPLYFGPPWYINILNSIEVKPGSLTGAASGAAGTARVSLSSLP